jgi:anti-anti-sigma factor
MEYSYMVAGDSLLFTVHGDLTMFNVSRLSEGIAQAVRSHTLPRVVIHGGNLQLIDSAAFGYLVRHNAELAEAGGRICFAELRPNVQSALTQLHLHETLIPYETADLALAAGAVRTTNLPANGVR